MNSSDWSGLPLDNNDFVEVEFVVFIKLTIIWFVIKEKMVMTVSEHFSEQHAFSEIESKIHCGDL